MENEGYVIFLWDFDFEYSFFVSGGLLLVLSCLVCNCCWLTVCIFVVVLLRCYLMCTCCTMCALLYLVLQMPDCWLEVSIRKVLRPTTSTQVFLGFPVPKSKC